MPYRKPYKKKRMTRRPIRKRTYKPRLAKPMRPATYAFKRSYSEVVTLNTSSPPVGWSATGNALHRQFVFKLSDLVDYQDFTNLFNQYKLTGVKIQLLFSNTASSAVSSLSSSVPATNSNSQIIMWIAPNPVGDTTVIGPLQMLKISAHKKRLCLNGGKPITMYKKLNQLSEIHGGGSNTDYAMVSPRWVGTYEPHSLHYGQNICLEKADQGVFAANATNYQSVRIIYTYYIKTRQVE